MQSQIYNELAGACSRFCKKYRSNEMRETLAKQEKENFYAPVFILIGDILHILDIFTDLKLAHKMYQISREDMYKNGNKFVQDYNKCFVWIVIATFGPYII